MMVLSEVKLTSTHKEDLNKAVKYCLRVYKMMGKDCNKMIFSRDGVDVEIEEGMTEISLFNTFMNRKRDERVV